MDPSKLNFVALKQLCASHGIATAGLSRETLLKKYLQKDLPLVPERACNSKGALNIATETWPFSEEGQEKFFKLRREPKSYLSFLPEELLKQIAQYSTAIDPSYAAILKAAQNILPTVTLITGKKARPGLYRPSAVAIGYASALDKEKGKASCYLVRFQMPAILEEVRRETVSV
jgi:hypothetical protein